MRVAVAAGENGAGSIADEEDRIDGVGGDKAEGRHEPCLKRTVAAPGDT